MKEQAQLHYRTCHLCEAMCGVVIEHDGQRVLSIKGDKKDSFSKGHVCPKAVALQDLHEDPDRLRTPVRRRGDRWEEISWEEAYDEIETRLGEIRARDGKDAVALYFGNPTAHNPGALLLLPLLVQMMNTRNRYSATSVDQLPNMLASFGMFGHQALLPIPDLDRTDFFLCIGANPAASNGSVMSAGNVMGRIRAIRERGGRVVVIDPRRTETVESADEHLFISPGADVFLLAGMLNVIFAEKRVRLRHLKDHVEGVSALRTLVREFTPEAVEGLTGIPAVRIADLAREFASAKRAVCYGRVGTCVQEFGSLTTWLIYALNVVTGNLDHEGGAMFTHPAIDLVGATSAVAEVRGSFDRYRSRVRQLPEFGGEFPVAILAEEILTPGEGQIKALITHAGNPVLSTPNGRQLDEALSSLEFMVSIDIYLNETTRHADIILPPTGPLEHGHYDVVLNAAAVRNVAKYGPALFPKAANQRHDWQILMELSVRLGARNQAQRALLRATQAVVERLGLEGMLDLGLRSGPYGQRFDALGAVDRFLSSGPASGLYKGIREQVLGLAKARRPLQQTLSAISAFSGQAQDLSMAVLKSNPHGVDLGPLRRSFPERLCTASGQIELVPAFLAGDLARARQKLGTLGSEGLVVIGRRHVRSNNSWMHNSYRLVKGKNRCTALMHPMDARARGIENGDMVSVRSRVGAIELPAQLSEDIMPGVVSVPHGWGHGRNGVRLATASAHAGVSLNDITDDHYVDLLTGMAVLNGVPVEVSRVEAAESARPAQSRHRHKAEAN